MAYWSSSRPQKNTPVRDKLQPWEGKAGHTLRLQLLQHVRHHGDQRQAPGVSLGVGREGGRQLSDQPQQDAVVGAAVEGLPPQLGVPHEAAGHNPQDLVQQAQAAAMHCAGGFKMSVQSFVSFSDTHRQCFCCVAIKCALNVSQSSCTQ